MKCENYFCLNLYNITESIQMNILGEDGGGDYGKVSVGLMSLFLFIFFKKRMREGETER